jgi:DNA-binding response OmpR family regulator
VINISNNINILIYDEGSPVCSSIEDVLRQSGMNVCVVRSEIEFERMRCRNDFDIVLINISDKLECSRSIYLFEKVRRDNRIGIVAVASARYAGMKMFVLSLGADAYFEMPINIKEIELAIRNLYARIRGIGGPAQSKCWLLDVEKWLLVSPNGNSQRLSQAEFVVISRLASNAGKPVSRESLLEDLGHRQTADGSGRSLDVLISRLRRKFSYTRQMLPVQSARGIGYVFPGVVVQGKTAEIFLSQS